MSLVFVFIGALSFIFVGFSLIISLLSTRYFQKGDIKKYLLYVNISFFFIIVPYALWYMQQVSLISTNPNFTVTVTDWVMAILIIISSFTFSASSLQLKYFSRVYGFRVPTGIKKKIASLKKKRD